MTEDQDRFPKLAPPKRSSPLSLRDGCSRRVHPLLLSVIAGAALLAILADGPLMVSALDEPQRVGAVAL
jgi:hypothetical protein